MKKKFWIKDLLDFKYLHFVSMIKNMDCLKDDVDISSYSLGLSHMYDRLKK